MSCDGVALTVAAEANDTASGCAPPALAALIQAVEAHERVAPVFREHWAS